MAALAACADSPPAPVETCRSVERDVVIDGVPQQALSTYCRAEDGSWALRQ